MRRLILAFAAATLAGSAALPAFALDLEVANNSKTTIRHIYMSETGAKKWGDDQLGDGDDDTIDPGDTYTLNDIDAGRYDLKLVAADGTECIVPDVDFANDKIWTITEAVLSSCAR